MFKWASNMKVMALEKTIKREVKCQGGQIGKSSSEGAHEKLCMTSHIKVSATRQIMISLLGSTYGNDDAHHTDNAYDQQKSVEWPAWFSTSTSNYGIPSLPAIHNDCFSKQLPEKPLLWKILQSFCQHWNLRYPSIRSLLQRGLSIKITSWQIRYPICQCPTQNNCQKSLI